MGFELHCELLNEYLNIDGTVYSAWMKAIVSKIITSDLAFQLDTFKPNSYVKVMVIYIYIIYKEVKKFTILVLI